MPRNTRRDRRSSELNVRIGRLVLDAESESGMRRGDHTDRALLEAAIQQRLVHATASPSAGGGPGATTTQAIVDAIAGRLDGVLSREALKQ